MKTLLVNEQNRLIIEKQLDHINGKALAHTFCAQDIFDLAEEAEKRGKELVKNQKLLEGCKFEAISGKHLPKAYDYSRIATCVELIRKRGGWAIDSLDRVKQWTTVPAPILKLTKAAQIKALAEFDKRFEVIE